MVRGDDRVAAIGVLLVLLGSFCAVGGGVVFSGFPVLRASVLGLTIETLRLLSGPDTLVEALVAALGLFLVLGGIMLVIAGGMVIRVRWSIRVTDSRETFDRVVGEVQE